MYWKLDGTLDNKNKMKSDLDFHFGFCPKSFYREIFVTISNKVYAC